MFRLYERQRLAVSVSRDAKEKHKTLVKPCDSVLLTLSRTVCSWRFSALFVLDADVASIVRISFGPNKICTFSKS